jgi:tRNA A-37 threonylcarbamoyl transferase component Bud32
MRFEEIRDAVAQEVREDLDVLRAQWATQTDEHDDMEAFVEWLHDAGKIGHDTFRAIHAGGGVVLTNFATLATYFGDDGDDDSDEVPSPAELPANGDTSLFPIRTRRTVLKLDPEGRFQFLGKLAAGAMGEIHIARDRDLQRKVAVKRMTDKVKRSQTLSARFYTEAQVTAQLDHPNIVPVYSLEADPEGGLTYTMKLIKGRTFSQLVADVRAALDAGKELEADLDLAARLEWFLRVCDAISYAHSRGVIHRDLKPDNIMVGKFGEVFVMDWGIARLGDRREAIDEELVDVALDDGQNRTRVGTVIGTPAYMSPEQAEGNNDLIDGRSDEFALGLILYELVCLEQALRGRDTMSLLLKVQRAEIEPIRAYRGQPAVAPELDAIIRKATARERERRYPHVKDLADDVRRHLRGEATKALPEGLYKRAQRWAVRRIQWLVGMLVVVLGVAAISAIGGLGTTVVTMQWAEQREAQMSDLLGIVAGRTHDLDAYLLTYEGLLKVLSASALESLAREPAAGAPEPYVGEPFAPADLVDSPRYGSRVSIGSPVYKRGEGLTVDDAMPSIRQLSALEKPFQRLLLSSSSEDALGSSPDEVRQLLLERGTPIAWAYVALQNGVLAHYPGHDQFPSPYDATRRPWYKLAEGARGPRWGSPHVDHGGLGLMLPCSMGLVDERGQQLGVAGIELSFDFIIEQLLEAPELAAVAETYVLDTTGRIVIQSSDKKRAGTDSALGKRLVRMKSFPYESVAAAAMAEPSGAMTVDIDGEGRQLFVWYRMKSTGWTYLIRGEERAILGAMGERS